MINIFLEKSSQHISPGILVDEDMEWSATDLATIMLWLDTGIFALKFHQTLSRVVDPTTLKAIQDKYILMKQLLKQANQKNDDKETLEMAITPIIPSDGYLAVRETDDN